MTSTSTNVTGLRIAGGLRASRPDPVERPERREQRATSYCDIWELVASGEPCPACHETYEDRLRKAQLPR